MISICAWTKLQISNWHKHLSLLEKCQNPSYYIHENFFHEIQGIILFFDLLDIQAQGSGKSYIYQCPSLSLVSILNSHSLPSWNNKYTASSLKPPQVTPGGHQLAYLEVHISSILSDPPIGNLSHITFIYSHMYMWYFPKKL